MPDETPDTMKTYDEQRLEKFSARGKLWNNYTLVFFGLAIALLLSIKYLPTELPFGPIGSLIVLMLMMLSAFISLILSAYFTWRARTLRKEIQYYSADPEPEDQGQTEIPE